MIEGSIHLYSRQVEDVCSDAEPSPPTSPVAKKPRRRDALLAMFGAGDDDDDFERPEPLVTSTQIARDVIRDVINDATAPGPALPAADEDEDDDLFNL